MGQAVLTNIVNEMKRAKYYNVSIDSTPDISHVDQLSVTVRYVNKSGPIERFLTLINFQIHTGQELARVLLSYLDDNGIDIANCRGQTYDNASSMSDQFNGVRANIQTVNPLAIFIPCFAHSLNLVGLLSAAVKYFDFVQKAYTFFSASTHCWQFLLVNLSKYVPVPNRLSNICWSSHATVTRALSKGYKDFCSALSAILSVTKTKQLQDRKLLIY